VLLPMRLCNGISGGSYEAAKNNRVEKAAADHAGQAIGMLGRRCPCSEELVHILGCHAPAFATLVRQHNSEL